MIKSIFRYPGGKSRGVNCILSYAPSSYYEYREPFVCGGSVFFNIPIDKKRWINDINDSLIAVYVELRDNSDEFIKKCQKIKEQKSGEKKIYPTNNSRGKKYNARLKKVFDYFVNSSKEEDQPLKYFFINRTVWGGRVNYNSKMSSRMYFSNHEGWNIIKNNKLERASKILQKTEITIYDSEKLLDDTVDNVWIYCDPRYIQNTLLSKT